MELNSSITLNRFTSFSVKTSKYHLLIIATLPVIVFPKKNHVLHPLGYKT
jgi:hypothetical protein